MKAVTHQGNVLTCKHADEWPPAPAYMNDDPLTVRAVAGEAEMTRYLTWKRDCGILRMDAAKCRACPHVVLDGVPASRVGSSGVHPPFMRVRRRGAR